MKREVKIQVLTKDENGICTCIIEPETLYAKIRTFWWVLIGIAKICIKIDQKFLDKYYNKL